jgi:hypothetical protein
VVPLALVEGIGALLIALFRLLELLLFPLAAFLLALAFQLPALFVPLPALRFPRPLLLCTRHRRCVLRFLLLVFRSCLLREQAQLLSRRLPRRARAPTCCKRRRQAQPARGDRRNAHDCATHEATLVSASTRRLFCLT